MPSAKNVMISAKLYPVCIFYLFQDEKEEEFGYKKIPTTTVGVETGERI